MAKTPHSSDAQWAAALKGALVAKEKLPPGKGWLTAQEVAKQFDLPISRCQVFLVQECVAGRFESFAGSRVSGAHFGARYCIWYRPVSR